jgi:hypothetical protein
MTLLTLCFYSTLFFLTKAILLWSEIKFMENLSNALTASVCTLISGLGWICFMWLDDCAAKTASKK